MRTTRGMLLTVLCLALVTLAACGSDLPSVPFAVNNEPVPLPKDLDSILQDSLAGSDVRLDAPDSTVPPISASKALEIAGKTLLEELAGNNVPAQDPSVADGLIRRRFSDPGERPPTSVWIVVYRWAAGFNCNSPGGGPGPCDFVSIYFIDDRTGETIFAHSRSN